MLAQPHSHVNAETKKLLTGITMVKEAWEALDRRFGSRKLAIITTQARLLHLNTGRGAPLEQLENLLLGVRAARTSFRAVQAEQTLFHDESLIGQLLDKIPSTYQDLWCRHSTSSQYLVDTREDGDKFAKW